MIPFEVNALYPMVGYQKNPKWKNFSQKRRDLDEYIILDTKNFILLQKIRKLWWFWCGKKNLSILVCRVWMASRFFGLYRGNCTAKINIWSIQDISAGWKHSHSSMLRVSWLWKSYVLNVSSGLKHRKTCPWDQHVHNQLTLSLHGGFFGNKV